MCAHSEMDGGAIQFKSYNEGVVSLMLQEVAAAALRA